jgi:glutaredoxin 3
MLGKHTPKVKIYTTPECPVCRKAKDYFTQKGMNFEEIDVAADREAAQDMVRRSGQMGVPVVMIDDTLIVGYNPLKLDVALKRKS